MLGHSHSGFRPLSPFVLLCIDPHRNLSDQSYPRTLLHPLPHLSNKVYERKCIFGCGDVEDEKHVLLICQKWSTQRLECLKELKDMRGVSARRIWEEFVNPEKDNEECIIKFVSFVFRHYI